VLKAMLLSKLKSTMAVVLILALLGMGAGGISRSAGPDDKEVQAVQDSSAEGGRSRRPAGPNEERLLISSQVSGIIVDVIKLGAKVRSGTVLVRLDDRAAKGELDRARATLEASKADHARAKAQLALASSRAERMKNLVAQKAIEKTVYDEALASLDQSRAALDRTQALVKVAAADLEKAQLLLTQHILCSPTAGTIRAVFKQPGAFVTAGARILEIGAIQPATTRKQGRAATDDLKKQIDMLEAEVARLEERAEWSERMAKRGYMTNLQAQTDRARLQQAMADLEHARKEAALRPPAGGTALEGLAARFRYRVPIQTGYTEFSQGGRLEILEIRGTRPKIEVGGQYVVRGRYDMPFQDEGTIYFDLTSYQWDKPQPTFDLQHVAVKKGQGEFTVLHGMAGSGGFHLYLIAKDRGREFRIANVYFGTGDNVRHNRP
jgi:multidrug efflux pump subunit AcrA (membrane-fusion protein)